MRYFSSSFALLSEPGAPFGQSSKTGCLLASGTISFGGGPGVAGGSGATCAMLTAAPAAQNAIIRRILCFLNMHTCGLTVLQAQMTRYTANCSLNRLCQLDNSPRRIRRCNAAQAHGRNHPVQRIINGNSDGSNIERYILLADDIALLSGQHNVFEEAL